MTTTTTQQQPVTLQAIAAITLAIVQPPQTRNDDRRVVREVARRAAAVGLTQPPQLAPLPVVSMFYPVAAALMLLSFALGYWWLRGAPISAARRRLWLASCVMLGLPAVFSLVCLEPRAARV